MKFGLRAHGWNTVSPGDTKEEGVSQAGQLCEAMGGIWIASEGVLLSGHTMGSS